MIESQLGLDAPERSRVLVCSKDQECLGLAMHGVQKVDHLWEGVYVDSPTLALGNLDESIGALVAYCRSAGAESKALMARVAEMGIPRAVITSNKFVSFFNIETPRDIHIPNSPIARSKAPNLIKDWLKTIVQVESTRQ